MTDCYVGKIINKREVLSGHYFHDTNIDNTGL